LKKTIKALLIASLLVIFLNSVSEPVLAQGQEQTDPVNIYFFWGDGCPHCAAEKPFLEALEKKYAPNVKLNTYEIYYSEENRDLFLEFGQALGFEPRGVPTTIVGDQYWVGFREEFQAEIELAVQSCLEQSCEVNPEAENIEEQTALQPEQPAEVDTAQDPPPVSEQPQDQPAEADAIPGNPSEHIINLPLIGPVDLDQQSLLVSTAIIGFVDGFNPCSLWVLSVLLAITLHSGSRTKTLIVGLTFLVTTTIIYSLFIAGVFTIFSYVGYLKWIQVLIGLLALAFGIVNLKDYFWYKEGVSFTISDKHKPKMYQNMRSTVTTPRSLIGLVTSTAVLAVGVSLIEFACTAGFPVIWSNLMLTNDVTTITFFALLGVYMVIYLVDELFIFGTAVATMKASKIEEKHGRILKLISGSVILTLSIVMLINPDLMNQFGTSLIVFSASLAGAGLIYLVHQLILPQFGIFIGTGFTKSHGKKKRK